MPYRLRPVPDDWNPAELIEQAVAAGFSRADAEHAYQHPWYEPEVEDLNRMCMEVSLGRKPARPDTPREAEIRIELAKDIAAAKANGFIISPVNI
jgi:hypothetical protein